MCAYLTQRDRKSTIFVRLKEAKRAGNKQECFIVSALSYFNHSSIEIYMLKYPDNQIFFQKNKTKKNPTTLYAIKCNHLLFNHVLKCFFSSRRWAKYYTSVYLCCPEQSPHRCITNSSLGNLGNLGNGRRSLKRPYKSSFMHLNQLQFLWCRKKKYSFHCVQEVEVSYCLKVITFSFYFRIKRIRFLDVR